MIPIYQAIEFKGEMKGGSTRPWLVTVLKDQQPVPYVAKLYTEINNEQNSTVFKECVCSYLAKEFDLDTPEPALIDFTPAFIKTLPDRYREILQQKDSRLKFATMLLPSPYENYSPALQDGFLKSYDIATIYAFDNLILNVDRRIDKPNLFFRDGYVSLIDHELTLATTKNAYNELTNNKLWTHNYPRHLFFEPLKKMSIEDKQGIYDTFSYYLTELVDLRFMPKILDQLDDCGYMLESYESINRYLCAAQNNAKRFIQLIENTLS